jgi:branched-chain amino acid transport system ATP-binding protein
MSQSAILEIEGLDAAYGLAQILFDLSLRVSKGEVVAVVALMGRNGAGKSTTLKAVMGLLPAQARTLRFAGHDIRGMAPFRIARLGLGFVPEERRIFTDLSVAENLKVGSKPAVGDRARRPWTPERLFAIFPNLAEIRGRRASQISGGEQQMLAIARTLMGNPEAVLLDEPSEGLAPVIVDEMAAAVSRMKAEGIAVLLSEHNPRFACAVADRAYVIAKGVIRHEGPMAEIIGEAALCEGYFGV